MFLASGISWSWRLKLCLDCIFCIGSQYLLNQNKCLYLRTRYICLTILWRYTYRPTYSCILRQVTSYPSTWEIKSPAGSTVTCLPSPIYLFCTKRFLSTCILSRGGQVKKPSIHVGPANIRRPGQPRVFPIQRFPKSTIPTKCSSFLCVNHVRSIV